MDGVRFTQEMRDAATRESKKREKYIKHHFEVKHLTSEERNHIGFLGEFAFCQLMGVDWRSNIRENYLTIDDCDFKLNNLSIDVKTETVPKVFFERILNGTIRDDQPYGRRLYSEGQFNLLEKYDLVVFGLIIRENPDIWFPVGFVEAKYIQDNYRPTTITPYGKSYPSPGAPVRTSSLRSIAQLNAYR